jgi:hypothetical protein
MASEMLQRDDLSVYVVAGVPKSFKKKLQKFVGTESKSEGDVMLLDEEMTDWVLARVRGEKRRSHEQTPASSALWRAYRALSAARYHLQDQEVETDPGDPGRGRGLWREASPLFREDRGGGGGGAGRGELSPSSAWRIPRHPKMARAPAPLIGGRALATCRTPGPATPLLLQLPLVLDAVAGVGKGVQALEGDHLPGAMTAPEVLRVVVEPAERLLDAVEVAPLLRGEEGGLLPLHGLGPLVGHVVRVGSRSPCPPIPGRLGHPVPEARGIGGPWPAPRADAFDVSKLFLGQHPHLPLHCKFVARPFRREAVLPGLPEGSRLSEASTGISLEI